MLFSIANLIVEVPEVGDMVPHCKEYWCPDGDDPDIVIRVEDFRPDKWQELTEDLYVYMETGSIFCRELLKHNGLYLHSSAVAKDGRGYLFSAPCGTGKSTHTRLWQQVFGENAKVFNDDKPALRLLDGTWYAYGTPWCGKDHININMKVPLAGICFLKRGEENRIRRVSQQEAIAKILWQTIHKFKSTENMDRMLSHVGKLVQMIPVYEMECLPNEEAARLSYETMRRGAEEMGL